MQVVQASCALHDIQTVPQPLFVHWVQEPRSVLLGMFTRSMLVLVVSSVICIVVASIMVFLATCVRARCRSKLQDAELPQLLKFHSAPSPIQYSPHVRASCRYNGPRSLQCGQSCGAQSAATSSPTIR